ncbi:hypothetical protein RhiirA5_427631 [Rhizophagus irregularis]|uniref:Uncharacterized protein n=1 Tax=Rhizophagus irregularis TaxID=588596 RepID=A0A2N0P1Z2_9GLOM|nr:hypothetical protein RhiirA5_427631 [Rhizophagus irregularis]
MTQMTRDQSFESFEVIWVTGQHCLDEETYDVNNDIFSDSSSDNESVKRQKWHILRKILFVMDFSLVIMLHWQKLPNFTQRYFFMMVMKRLDDTSNMIIVWEKLGVVSVHHMHLSLLMKLSTNVQTLIVQIVCLFLFKEGQLSLISLNTDLDHPHLRLFTLELKDNSYHSLIKSYPALGQILEAVEANRLKD